VVNNDAKTAGLPILSWQSGATPYILQGDGLTADTAYQITNVGQLQTMSYSLDKYYQLANNINADISGYNTGVGFNPVGTSANPFTGDFDGDSHTVTNLYINRPSTDNIGLFGYTLGSQISNTGLVGGSIKGQDYIGALVGYAKQTTVQSSYSSMDLSVGDGWNYGEFVGGLIGQIEGSTVYRSYTTGNISGTGSVGGLVGNAMGPNNYIEESYTTGNIYAARDSASGVISSWYPYPSPDKSVTIRNSYSLGNVRAQYHSAAGITTGAANGDPYLLIIENCYSAGVISSDGRNWKGGIVSDADSFSFPGSSITSSYFLSPGGDGSIFGTLVTADQMEDPLTFSGWDIFSPVWDIFADQSPRLSLENHAGERYFVWDGAVSSAWSDDSNWARGTPQSGANIFISERAFDPILIQSDLFEFYHIRRHFTQNADLTITGDYTQRAVFSPAIRQKLSAWGQFLRALWNGRISALRGCRRSWRSICDPRSL
jgi:hypothetical protein